MAPPQRVVVNQGQRDMLVVYELSALLGKPNDDILAQAAKLAWLLPAFTQQLVVTFITEQTKHHTLLSDLLCIL
jgi:hypothetical protein